MKKSPVTVVVSIVLAISLLANVFLGIKVINSDGSEVKTSITGAKQEANANSDETEFTPYELSGAPQTLMNTDYSEHVDYDFEIKSARIDTNYDNKPVVVVTYSFTNNTDSTEDFKSDLDCKAFQNGVELEGTYSLSSGRDLKGDENTDIMPGYTSEFEVAYLLNDSATDIVVQITRRFSNSTVFATRTFTMK